MSTSIVKNLLHWAIGELLGALPEHRDWLNPDAEKVLRAVHTGPKLAGADLDLRDLDRLFAESQETGRPVTLSASACGILLDAMATGTTAPASPSDVAMPEHDALTRFANEIRHLILHQAYTWLPAKHAKTMENMAGGLNLKQIIEAYAAQPAERSLTAPEALAAISRFAKAEHPYSSATHAERRAAREQIDAIAASIGAIDPAEGSAKVAKTEQSDYLTVAFEKGQAACKRGEGRDTVPYNGNDLRLAWFAGFDFENAARARVPVWQTIEGRNWLGMVSGMLAEIANWSPSKRNPLDTLSQLRAESALLQTIAADIGIIECIAEPECHDTPASPNEVSKRLRDLAAGRTSGEVPAFEYDAAADEIDRLASSGAPAGASKKGGE